MQFIHVYIYVNIYSNNSNLISIMFLSCFYNMTSPFKNPVVFKFQTEYCHLESHFTNDMRNDK